MKKAFITLFTPAFNRAYRLPYLYESLIRQTCKEFIWYVIDDGSSDNTKEVVTDMINEGKIRIVYEYQNNSGKHVAHNKAVEKCETELFFCVDSDDFLTDNAVEDIKAVWNEISATEKDKLSGIVANRGYKGGTIVGTKFPAGVETETLSKLYSLGKKGDTALIFRTAVIKQYPFPVFEGERFLREHIVYDKIDEQYKLVVLDRIIYICEYLAEGLSKNATALEMKSPKGAALARLHDAKRQTTLLNRIAKLTGFVFFSIVADEPKKAIEELGMWKFICLLPLVLLFYLRYKIKRSF